ncbi:MAG: hypothetical protein JWO72_874 [Caulobacteraceae bacterium]|nr:hypothetical protein [Caulobacteraceae bacterium]
MPFDFIIALEQATVAVGQVPGGGPATAATGFLVNDPLPDGTPRIVLVTARHVLTRIAGPQLQIGLHLHNPDGTWRKEWWIESISDGDRPLWARHPVYDVAVLPVQTPPEVAAQAIPIAWLADENTFERDQIAPGDQMNVLGFADGLASDERGFAILRSGHLSSYPLTPATQGTFLIDYAVVTGNSGAPVFRAHQEEARRAQPAGSDGPAPDEFIAGMLAQQIIAEGRSINLGLAVHAVYIRQTLKLLDAPPEPSAAPAP